MGVREIVTAKVLPALRKTLNSALDGTTPEQLINAVNNDLSLWGEAGETIKHYSTFLPPFAIGMAEKQLSKIDEEHEGGVTGLVMSWLREDHPIYHSLLLNMDGGKLWLERQVNEILNAFGIRLRK